MNPPEDTVHWQCVCGFSNFELPETVMAECAFCGRAHDMTPVIVWTAAKLAAFKKVYEKNKDSETFMFEGYEFVPAYAKHLISFLEIKFKH